MIPLIKKLVHAFLFDEGAVTGWIRGFFLTAAAGGVAFADQVAEALGDPGAAKIVKITAIVCGFIGGTIRAGEKNPPSADNKGAA